MFACSCLTGILLLLHCSIFAAEYHKGDNGYKINFENVAAKEFVKFISKISDTNILYNEEELDFNLTMISEEETTLSNLMSAFTQLLRIHGLTILEEDRNLIIHKNDGVRQIPMVVPAEKALPGNITLPIVTKVFSLQRGNVATIANLITPMLSMGALIEVANDTRQLIITDTPNSLAKIQDLLHANDIFPCPLYAWGICP